MVLSKRGVDVSVERVTSGDSFSTLMSPDGVLLPAVTLLIWG